MKSDIRGEVQIHTHIGRKARAGPQKDGEKRR